jgi:hypothetical protein
MNGKILNSPVRPSKNTLKPHHIRHIISGTLVFILGIAANEGLTYLRRHGPRHVRWTSNEMQVNYLIPGGLPPTNIQVETGIAEDGTVVWRPRKD